MSAFARGWSDYDGLRLRGVKSLPFYIGSIIAVLNAALVFVVLVLNRNSGAQAGTSRVSSYSACSSRYS